MIRNILGFFAIIGLITVAFLTLTTLNHERELIAMISVTLFLAALVLNYIFYFFKKD